MSSSSSSTDLGGPAPASPSNLELRMAVDQHLPEDTGSNAPAILKVARVGVLMTGAGVAAIAGGMWVDSLVALVVGVIVVPLGVGTLGIAAFFGYADWAVRRKRPSERAVLLSGAYNNVTITTVTLKGPFGNVKGKSHGVRVQALTGKHVFIPTNGIAGERLAHVLQKYAQPG